MLRQWFLDDLTFLTQRGATSFTIGWTANGRDNVGAIDLDTGHLVVYSRAGTGPWQARDLSAETNVTVWGKFYSRAFSFWQWGRVEMLTTVDENVGHVFVFTRQLDDSWTVRDLTNDTGGRAMAPWITPTAWSVGDWQHLAGADGNGILVGFFWAPGRAPQVGPMNDKDDYQIVSSATSWVVGDRERVAAVDSDGRLRLHTASNGSPWSNTDLSARTGVIFYTDALYVGSGGGGGEGVGTGAPGALELHRAHRPLPPRAQRRVPLPEDEVTGYFVSFAPSGWLNGDRQNVAGMDIHGHLQVLGASPADDWSATDVTAATGATVWGVVSGWSRAGIDYVAASTRLGDLLVFSRVPGGPWQVENVSQGLSLPALSSPSGWQVGSTRHLSAASFGSVLHVWDVVTSGDHTTDFLQGGFGEAGDFEWFVASGGGLRHFTRRNDQPGLPWRMPDVALATFGSTVRSGRALESTFLPSPNLPGNFELVAQVSPGPGAPDRLVFYWYEKGQWLGGQPLVVERALIDGVTGPPGFIQSRGATGRLVNFELLVPQGEALVHYARLNGLAGLPWVKRGALPPYPTDGTRDFVFTAATILQSNFGFPGNLELIARVTAPPEAHRSDFLVTYWFDSTGWHGPFDLRTQDGALVEGVSGCPAFMQMRAAGATGDFVLVVPQGEDLVHYQRANDEPGLPWRRAGVLPAYPVSDSRDPTWSDASIFQSNYRARGDAPGNFELIVRVMPPPELAPHDFYAFYWFEPTTGWHGPFDVTVDGERVWA